MEQQRELKQVWMAPDTRKGSRYAWHTLGGVIGIMLLAVLLVTGGTVLTLYMGLSQEVLLVLCAAVTLLVLWLALRAARRSVREDTLFFLTKTDRFYGIQARMLVKYSGHMLGQTFGTISVQNLLRKMANKRLCLPKQRKSCRWNRSGKTAVTMWCGAGYGIPMATWQSAPTLL